MVQVAVLQEKSHFDYFLCVGQGEYTWSKWVSCSNCHIPSGRPGTGINLAPPSLPGVAFAPCDFPHRIFNLRPFKINLLKDLSAAVSAEYRFVKQTKAHCCLGTIVMERISPNW
jgi:hypothetical protein